MSFCHNQIHHNSFIKTENCSALSELDDFTKCVKSATVSNDLDGPCLYIQNLENVTSTFSGIKTEIDNMEQFILRPSDFQMDTLKDSAQQDGLGMNTGTLTDSQMRHCLACPVSLTKIEHHQGLQFGIKKKSAKSMIKYNGKKSFKCTHCAARFEYECHLTSHMRTHTGEKPFECAHCDARFGQKTILIRHMRTHTGEKPFECAHCDARFGQKTVLIRHMRTHTGEKPFQCTLCDARFADKSNLTSHIRTHTGEKPFQCALCEARFGQKTDLIRHENSHRRKTI